VDVEDIPLLAVSDKIKNKTESIAHNKLNIQ
jgi:hypothetical protein